MKEHHKKEHAGSKEHHIEKKHAEHHKKHYIEKHEHQKKHVHQKSSFKEYLQSWKKIKSLTYVLVVAYDLGFYALMFLLFYVYGKLIVKLTAPFKGIDPGTIGTQSAEQLAVYQQSLGSLVFFVFTVSLLFGLLFVLLWSVSRGLIWSRLLDKKAKFKYFGKFYLLNIIWIFFWSILVIIYAVLFYSLAGSSRALGIISGIVFLIVLILVAYLSYIMYFRFTLENRIFRSIKDAFVLGVKKFPRLSLPFVLAVGTIIIVSLLSMLLRLLPEIVMDVVSYILFFGVFGWMKIYGADVLKERIS